MPASVITAANGYLEIVALNGSSFIAKIDEPGPCPGDGWQLIASAGKPGKPGMKGDRGEAGPKGEKGEAGLPAVHIVGWRIDRKRYHIYPVMSDSREGKPIEMRELFVQYNEES